MDGLLRLYTPLAAPLQPFAAQLAAAMVSGRSALVTGLDGSVVLAAASDALSNGRTRVLHVRPPLDLDGFMEQVVHAGTIPGGVTDLEQGFDALTRPDTFHDSIALLVEDAHRMPETTLRYIELALRAGPHLQVALAGQMEVADTLALPGFSGLRKRLSLHLVLPAPDPPAVVMDLLPAASAASTGRSRRVRVVGALAGVAFAAGLAVAVWMPAVPPAPPDTPAIISVLDGPSHTVAALPPSGAPAIADLVEARQAVAPTTESIPNPAPSDALPADTQPDAPAPPAAITELHGARSVSAQEGADPPGVSSPSSPPVTEPGLAPLPAVPAEPSAAPALAFAEPPAARQPDAPLVAEPSLIPPVETRAEPHAASPAQMPSAMLPKVALPRPAIPYAPNPARRTPQAGPERVAARPPVPSVDVRHCRDIVLRAQLGEDLTHGDQSFMRNGCR